MWHFTGEKRPPFADEPGPGQESVWDYPRPPVLVPSACVVEVFASGQCIAHSGQVQRVLETASPPTYYIPAADVDWQYLVQTQDLSYCEWKGEAIYWALTADSERTPVGWSYQNPSDRFAAIDRHISFYPGRVECFVDGERVRPQPGEFYGGWVTSKIVGPFKGGPGTGHW